MRSFASRLGILAVGLLPVFAAACSAETSDEDITSGEDAITSTDGQPLQLKFTTEVVASRETPA